MTDTQAQAAVQPLVPETEDAVEIIVPKDYFECHVSDLATMVSATLEEIITLNDTLPFNSEKLTRFHSRVPPSISVRDYLFRIVKFCTINKAMLIVLLHYIDLLSGAYSNFVLNSLTVHRFIITSITIASKGLCDSFCANAHCAKVGGVSQIELNLLEAEFLTRVNYKLLPNPDLLAQYFNSVIARHPLQKYRQLSNSPSVRYPDTGDYSTTNYNELLEAAKEELKEPSLMESVVETPTESSVSLSAQDQCNGSDSAHSGEPQIFKKFGVKHMRKLWSSAGQHRKRSENEREETAGLKRTKS